jgi:hypothetical protein
LDPSKIELLGGKGANLSAMTALGLPVPPGFTITTEAWRACKDTGTPPAGLSEEVERHLGRLEGAMGRSFGDPKDDPLLVSVRIERDIDRVTLRQIVSSIVSEYVAGAYAVPKRADEYKEADAGLTSFLVKPETGLVDKSAAPSQQEVKVWAVGDHEGLHIMLPEDY